MNKHIRSGDFQSSNVVATLAVDIHYLSGANPVTTEHGHKPSTIAKSINSVLG